jgi:hypothetical protein
MINGKPVMKMEDVKDGDVLKTWVQDGVIESVVRR